MDRVYNYQDAKQMDTVYNYQEAKLTSPLGSVIQVQGQISIIPKEKAKYTVDYIGTWSGGKPWVYAQGTSII